MNKRVIVIGSINYDNFLRVPHLVKKGENIHANEVKGAYGGKGANQAVQCAKLGLETYFVGAVGDDVISVELIKALAGYGVNTEFVKKTEGPSGQAYVIAADDGSVQGVVIKGANWKVDNADVDSVLQLIDKSSIVVLQMEIPMETVCYAIDKAYEKGAEIVLNTAPAAPLDNKYFKKLSTVVFNETEAGYYLNSRIEGIESAKEAAKLLNEKFSCNCLLTLGPLGALYRSKDTEIFSPAEDVEVIETTGAGDSFIGGYIFGIANNLDLEETLSIASKCSGYTIGGVGAQNSMPFLKDIISV